MWVVGTTQKSKRCNTYRTVHFNQNIKRFTDKNASENIVLKKMAIFPGEMSSMIYQEARWYAVTVFNIKSATRSHELWCLVNAT